MSGHDGAAETRHRVIKIAFGAAALVCLLVGLFLYLFPDVIGMDPETAELVAIAFLLAGVFDYLILRFWDRLVARR